MRHEHLTPLVILLVLSLWPLAFAHARDDGRYAGSSLKSWFDQLRSGKGPCCSDADGYALAGRTMVWPIWGYQGPSIRCFMPGPMT